MKLLTGATNVMFQKVPRKMPPGKMLSAKMAPGKVPAGKLPPENLPSSKIALHEIFLCIFSYL